MSVALTYSMIIKWSDEDSAYLVHLPEFGPDPRTHGETYEEAAKNAHEVLEMLVESYMEDGEALPVPAKYHEEPEPPQLPKSNSARGPFRKMKHTKAIPK